MSDFGHSTAFGFVRRLAATGVGCPSMYLLLSESSAIEAVQADLVAEIEVQLGSEIRMRVASEVAPEKLEQAFLPSGAPAVTLVRFDRWVPQLVQSLDRNVVLLTRAGVVLLLSTMDLGRRTLAAAPNLRSRITDVLSLTPDEGVGGRRA